MESDFGRKIVLITVFMLILIMISFAANCKWLMITATVCLPAVIGIWYFICRIKLKSDSCKKTNCANNKPKKERKKAHIIILTDNDDIIDYGISNS